MSRFLDAATPAEHLLAYRLHQQSLLAEFGQFALGCGSFDDLLQRATELCARGLRTPFAKVLEYCPAENRLLVRAGVGWAPGIVGVATIGADLESPAGYALRTGSPVISNHLDTESRFRVPSLLAGHGIRRAINVVIRNGETGDPFGVLEADSASPGLFDAADLAFMQGFANLLGVAIARQNARAAQTQAGRELDALFNSAPVGNAWADPAGRLMRVNPALCAMTGYTAHELLGRSFADLTHPDDRAADLACFARLAAGEIPVVEAEKRYVRKDGSLLWVCVHAVMVRDAAGHPIRTSAVIRDLSLRHRTQDALRASEARYRAIVETAVDAIVLIDARGIVQSFNPAAERVFGYGAGEVLGQNIRMLMNPRDREAHDGYLGSYLRTGEARIIGIGREVVGRRKDGSEFPLDLAIAEWHAEGETFFTGIMRDVSERRQAEEANARLAAIVSSSGDAIVSFRVPDGRILTWNRGAERLFGYTEAEAVGGPVTLLLPPERPDGPTGVFARAMAGERVELDTVRVHRSGERIDVSITATQVRTPDGRALGVSIIYRDIRERKRAEALMREALAHQETLTREISHRVKNSLTLVAALLGMQARSAQHRGVRDALQDAEARVGAIAEVHDQLWRRGDVTSVDLADFLGGLCAKLQETAPHHTLVFRADEPITVATDRAIPLGLLLNELVTNAIKYAYPGSGGEVRVMLSRNGPEGMRLEVADRGVGLPAGFNPVRLPGGLGSRLIAGFVRQLEATLQVACAHPGARFVIDVPRLY
ncbi:PAS domain S-box protein [Microvirga massiliensis]|uniref:PAS domain S-box protein n=1 Tax=Microvirga massiliensis TaxID=1033741 RepID=UPI00069C39E1